MEYWLVIIFNILIGIALSFYNIIIAVPIVLMGLTLGLALIIIMKLWR